MKNIGILASGSGSNAVKILEYFKDSEVAKVAGVFSNKPKAPVLEKFLERDENAFYFESNAELIEMLKGQEVDFIVLAGYLKLIPAELTAQFPNAIVNIHPALLPKYGGKGMYGHHVHKAVKDNQESLTGITIHYVNEVYDEGEVIFQAEVNLKPEDSVKDIIKKVQVLEHEHYAVEIERLLKNQ
ncbi:MAG: phosphoribosylglycinamide formyltransferase [Flavobacteriales bacterium]